MTGLLSHPPKEGEYPLLTAHLQKVGEFCASLIEKAHPNLNIPQSDLTLAGFIVGACHDFGKAKRQFQDYIWGRKRGGNKDHSLISSIFTFIVAKEFFFKKANKFSRFLPFICAYVVNRHHGILTNLEEAFPKDRLDDEFDISKANLDERIWDFKIESPCYGVSLYFNDFKDNFFNFSIDSFFRQVQELARILRDQAERTEIQEWLFDLYFSLLLLLSALTEADRATVIEAPLPETPQKLSKKIVRDFAFKRPPAPLPFQELRKNAWEEVERFLKIKHAGTLRLTLPTWSGKTLMGLYLAASLQEEAVGPIIYALPCLSIIEQATEVARSMFPLSTSNIAVIQHHSLSFPQPKEDETPNFEEARFALESWDADLVVTTFDQLFYSFLSQERGFIRRFFQLPNSVLILDEVQTLPARLIPAVQELLQKMNERLGTKILYMTATHPPFLKKAQPLLKNEEDYFKPLQRTRLVLKIKEPLPFSKYLEGLNEWLLERKGKSLLFVTNTIRCSLELFDHLFALKEDPDFEEMELFYLSGNVAPVHRLKRIQEIKQLLNKASHPWIVVVSTQCVEAGVDIDMDEIVRDFAPWDSIMQVCGRANRFGSKEEASIWLYEWEDDLSERSQRFHRYIYDPILTEATKDVFNGFEEIRERDFWDLHSRYIRRLEEALSKEKSRELLEKALSWQFDGLEFRELFRGVEGWKVSLFCVADETAARLQDIAVLIYGSKDLKGALKSLEQLCGDTNLFEPLSQFLRISPEVIKKQIKELWKKDERQLRFLLARFLNPMFQAYTISIPVRSLENLKGKISFVSKEKEVFPFAEYYDPVRGFSPVKGDIALLSLSLIHI